MRDVTVAATHMACSWDRDANVERACALARLAREPAREGRQPP